MEVKHSVCCGIDVHQEVVVACIRKVSGQGQVSLAYYHCGTMKRDLEQLLAWLRDQGCRIVAMESTGVYWKPVYHILAPQLEVVVGNARHLKPPRGKKTDKSDATWLAELLAHDLIRPSFIPPKEICALRDLTRTRTALVNQRTQAKNRVHKVLQDTNIKLTTVASDIFGVSGRKMLDALISGQHDPKALAQLARGVLRKKIPQLELALEGQFTEHHGLLIRMSLQQVDLLDEQIALIDERVARLSASMNNELEHLMTTPGVNEQAARVIISEIGADMSRFGSDKRLASWAALCPGNNESAGKRKSGRTRRGNKYLRRVLNQSAWGTRRTNTFLGRTFRRLEARIGAKKAAGAVAHKILVIAYHLLANGTCYEEERYKPDPRRDRRRLKNALKTIESLGLTVRLEPLPEVA
jgi:transposase